MQSHEPPLPPREPEIEFLTRLVRTFLRGLRVALWIGGVVAVGYGAQRVGTFVQNPHWFEEYLEPDASGFVWITLGLPLVLPTGWALARGKWVLLGASALLWFAPQVLALASDHPYGFVLRIVASLVAVASLLVWRTLWRLVPPPRA